MSNQKVKVINDMVAAIMKMGVNFAEKQVEKKVSDPLVSKGVDLIFPLSKELIEALSDNNADNAKQVHDIMLQWTNDELSNYLEEVISAMIVKQKNDDVKQILTFVMDNFILIVRLLSDSDEHNAEQMQALWEQILDDEKTHKIVIQHIVKPLLVKSGANGQWIDFVVEVADTAFKGLIAKKDSQSKLIEQAKSLK